MSETEYEVSDFIPLTFWQIVFTTVVPNPKLTISTVGIIWPEKSYNSSMKKYCQKIDTYLRCDARKSTHEN